MGQEVGIHRFQLPVPHLDHLLRLVLVDWEGHLPISRLPLVEVRSRRLQVQRGSQVPVQVMAWPLVL